jgi:hypothetical protein
MGVIVSGAFPPALALRAITLIPAPSPIEGEGSAFESPLPLRA